MNILMNDKLVVKAEVSKCIILVENLNLSKSFKAIFDTTLCK